MKARALRKLKRDLEYDADTPRCENCASFGRNIHNQRPVRWCFWSGFVTEGTGLCNAWRGKNGDRLQTEEQDGS